MTGHKRWRTRRLWSPACKRVLAGSPLAALLAGLLRAPYPGWSRSSGHPLPRPAGLPARMALLCGEEVLRRRVVCGTLRPVCLFLGGMALSGRAALCTLKWKNRCAHTKKQKKKEKRGLHTPTTRKDRQADQHTHTPPPRSVPGWSGDTALRLRTGCRYRPDQEWVGGRHAGGVYGLP